jgi:hypothetical protein
MRNPPKKSTIRDFQVKLTLSQFERLKGRAIQQSDFASELPKAKYLGIRAYLNDPDYHIRLIRPFKGNPPAIYCRLNRVDEVITLPTKTASFLLKMAQDAGITPNQFINQALHEKLQVLEGKKLREGALLMGMEFYDHIIVGAPDGFLSFRSNNWLSGSRKRPQGATKSRGRGDRASRTTKASLQRSATALPRSRKTRRAPVLSKSKF